MPLLIGTQQQYYGSETFTGDGSATSFTLTFPSAVVGSNTNPTMPLTSGEFVVTVNGVVTSVTYNATTFVITFGSAPSASSVIVVTLNTPELGNYQYISMQTIINNFIVAYVGEGKIIPRTRRSDVAYHAQRGLQELSYDTLRSEKSQEIELPPTLTMALPHDYVNYVKFCWTDSSGIERVVYPARKTSNPTGVMQDGSFNYIFDSSGNLQTASNSDTWTTFSATNASGSTSGTADDTDMDTSFIEGRRYGLTPEHAHVNGVFFIDNKSGYVHFSSDLSGKVIQIKYISDSLGTEDEMIVHKLAEEAMYKHIAHAILSTKANVQEYIIQRFKKERFAAIRTAKIRLSNFKSEEIRQVLRNKSKQIK